MKHEDLHLANARGVGQPRRAVRGRTGGDGIGGVSVLASETFDATGPSKRPAVQVGDPFQEKVLIECCLDLFHAGLSRGSRTSAVPGCPAPRANWPRPVTAGCWSTSTASRCATPRSRPRRSS